MITKFMDYSRLFVMVKHKQTVEKSKISVEAGLKDNRKTNVVQCKRESMRIMGGGNTTSHIK